MLVVNSNVYTYQSNEDPINGHLAQGSLPSSAVTPSAKQRKEKLRREPDSRGRATQAHEVYSGRPSQGIERSRIPMDD